MNTKTNTNRSNRSHGYHPRQFVPVMNNKTKKPSVVRFEHLRPGSFFQIFAEPSRGIRTSNDHRIYQLASEAEGRWAFHVASPAVAILMPNDLVIPYRLVEMEHEG